MECLQEAPAHLAGFEGVQGRDTGLGAVVPAQVMRQYHLPISDMCACYD